MLFVNANVLEIKEEACHGAREKARTPGFISNSTTIVINQSLTLGPS